jgi:hypothetical protein
MTIGQDHALAVRGLHALEWGERVPILVSTPGVSGVATASESKHPVHIVAKCAPPNRR